ncbi:MAG: cysteine--tRNA ligase [Candidatus Magasanikbacteria bacterium]|nr:cysteine--tRNA ligase [Candidatus Magasanikbacteria bacterium]
MKKKRKHVHFVPLKKNNAGLYTCGPTVYNYAHIGNLRSYVFEDVLKRVLKYNKYKVKHVMNITDVGHLTSDADEGEDKMEKGAKREGKTAWEIAKFYTKAFQQNLVDLNILAPDIWCRATDHITEQIKLVQKLIDKGVTYETSDGIYFDTTKIDDYGKLANLKTQNLKPGARVKLGEKKNPHDFALWKFTPTGQKRQMEWKAFEKMGFPGWHIECSAMSMKYLGKQFDIHCGGIDHIPVHHTNEIAQSETATGKKPWVKYWLHNEFVNMSNPSTGAQDKMSKSLSNFITLDTLKTKNISPLAYRYFLLQTHYRKQLSFSWEALEAAQNGLDRLYGIVKSWKDAPKIGCAEYEQKFLDLVNNDLNTPEALALMWNLVKSDYPVSAKKRTLFKFDEVLGLGIKTLKYKNIKTAIPDEVQKLLAARATARAGKDWKESDRLREEIREIGFQVVDSADGHGVKKLKI